MTTESITVSRSEYERPERKRGARLMLSEAVTAAVASSMYGNFTGALIIKLGATVLQVGLQSAITQLLCVASQLSSAHLANLMGGRKRMVVGTIFASALPWVFIACVPFMPQSIKIWTLIPLSAVAWALYSISDPVWGSWMSDMVPHARRGAYMGLRGSIATMVSTAVGMGAAAVLDHLHGAVMWGFTTVFLIAMLARIISGFIFLRVVDPRPELRLNPGPPPWKQFKDLRKTVLGRVNIFVFLFSFAANLMNPLFSVYLLRDLGISYMLFVGMGVVSNVFVILVLPLWGRLADKRGNKFVMAISVPWMALWPLLFLISVAPWYLLFTHVLIGILTPGWGVAVYNFVLENSREETRPTAMGYFQALASAGSFVGALVGGAVAPHLPQFMAYQLMTLFVISVGLRFSSVVYLWTMVLPRAGRVQVSVGKVEEQVEDKATLSRPVRALRAVPELFTSRRKSGRY